MSDALLYEFSGVSADDYLAVNEKLGLDPAGRRLAPADQPHRRSWHWLVLRLRGGNPSNRKRPSWRLD